MHTSVRSSLSVGAAVAVTTALVLPVGPPEPPPVPAPVTAAVRLLADPVPPGGLLTSFLGNQVIYCSIICPDVVKLAVTVPVGVVTAPVAFLGGLASGNVFRAIGAAAASVTNPLEATFDPIITNDLNLVLPRAQNALEVAVVGLLNIATAGPGHVAAAIQTARQNTFDALNDTIPPSQTAPNPKGLLQVVAVEAINVASSIAFQAFEEGLLGIVQTADAAASALAHTGNPLAAFVAGEKAAFASLHKTLGYIVTAGRQAIVNIAAALHDPTGMATTTNASAATTPTPTPSVRVSDRHAAVSPVTAHARLATAAPDAREVVDRPHRSGPPKAHTASGPAPAKTSVNGDNGKTHVAKKGSATDGDQTAATETGTHNAKGHVTTGHTDKASKRQSSHHGTAAANG